MYQRLEAALSQWISGGERDKPSKGTLGYTVDGVYRVTVAENPSKYYVRFAEGNFAQVFHRGRVAPVPDLPVEVGTDSAGNAVILGGDPDRAGMFDGAHEVGPHSHARGSGLEFPVDLRLLTPVKAAPLGGLTVGVAQGAYLHGGSLRWWGGGAITLTPPASANQWTWTVIGLDAEANALIAVSGSALVVTAPLDRATLPTLALAGAIPLAAVRVRNGQTELDDDDFEDLRWPVGGRGTSLIVVREEQAQNTSAGTFTSGAWRTRTLNVEASDADNHASLSASQITLDAGTYRLRASAPAFAVGAHQARWQNVSDGVTVAVGTTEVADPTAQAQTRSIVVGRFTISASKTFELQHRCATTRSTDGFGVAANFATECYGEVELWRE
ncbi:MAG: hypothetical protein ABI700_28860 [Chloroflexota bacterium]